MPAIPVELAGAVQQVLLLPWVVTLCGAFWALWSFSRNSRAKAADVVLKLEESYRASLKTLLALEHVNAYRAVYVPALREVIGAMAAKERRRGLEALDAEKPSAPVYEELKTFLDQESAELHLDDHEARAIDELEAAFRHFFMCYHVRRLGVDGGAMEQLCSYYLQVFWKLPEVRIYLAVYWPSLYHWSRPAGRSVPERLYHRVASLRPRLIAWWTGSSRPIGEVYERAVTAPPDDGAHAKLSVVAQVQAGRRARELARQRVAVQHSRSSRGRSSSAEP